MRHYDTYARLELISPEFEPLKQGRFAYLTRYLNQAKKQLIDVAQAWVQHTTQPNEPRIKVHRDRQGLVSFHAYDPVSHSRHAFSSEEALRVWLDQRYYQ